MPIYMYMYKSIHNYIIGINHHLIPFLPGVNTGLTWNQFTHSEGTGMRTHTTVHARLVIRCQPPPPPSPHRGGVLCVAMGLNGDVCFSGSTDANIRVWKIPPSDIDPYDNYGKPAHLLGPAPIWMYMYVCIYMHVHCTCTL